MKGLMKVFSGDLAVCREWRMIGLLREYVGVCAGNRSLGRPRKRWIDMVKDRLRKKIGLDVRQARRLAQDRNEWQGFVNGSAWSVARGIIIQTLRRRHSFMKPLVGSLSEPEPTT